MLWYVKIAKCLNAYCYRVVLKLVKRRWKGRLNALIVVVVLLLLTTTTTTTKKKKKKKKKNKIKKPSNWMLVLNVLIPTKTMPNVQYDLGEQPVFNDVIFKLPFQVLSLTTNLLH